MLNGLTKFMRSAVLERHLVGLVLLGSVACSSSTVVPSSEGGANANASSGGGDSSSGSAAPTDGSVTPSSEGGSGAGASSDGASDSSGSTGISSMLDDGPLSCDAGASAQGGAVCPSSPPSSLTILDTTYAAVTGGDVVYGTAPGQWVAYPVAAPGQASPVLTPSAGAVGVAANVVPTLGGENWSGVGVSFSTGCVDASSHNGVQFTLIGSLGGCQLFIDAITSQDESVISDPCRGACTAAAGHCVAPSARVQPSTQSLMTVAFSGFSGGAPNTFPQTRGLIGFRWRLQATSSDSGTNTECVANFTLGSVALLP